METARPQRRAGSAALPLVVVSGARVGVGATTVALNLAAVLADRAGRVLLVDGAQQRNDAGDAPVSHGKVAYSLGDMLAGKCSAREAILDGPAGIQMLVNRWDARTTPDFSRRAQQRLVEELESLVGDVDYIVLDAGPGQSSWAQRLWQRARVVALVTTPDDDAVLDAYASLKLAFADGSQMTCRLVVNQAESDAAAASTHRRIHNSCQRFLLQSIAALPALPRHVRESMGAPAAPRVWESPNTPFGHAMLWLGRAVAELVASESARRITGSTGFAAMRAG